MNNQIKVFLSSTFEDMQSEREYLVKKIFPAIKAECEKRDVEFSVVDLRWGISEEQSSPGKIIDICLNEIDGSHPFFIGMIGERYGTMWSREHLNGDEEILRRRPWVEHCLDDGMSITEMEMQYGVFESTDDIHAFFYIRKDKWYSRFIEKLGKKTEKHLQTEKLNKLIAKIAKLADKGKVKAEHYNSVPELGKMVYRQLMDMVESLYPVIEEGGELERQARIQQAWMHQLCNTYFDDERVKYMECLLDDADQKLPVHRDFPDQIWCKHVSVGGKQGVGKSALLANICNGKRNFFYIKVCDQVSDETQLLALLKYMVENAGLDYAHDPIFCAIDDSEKLIVESKSFERWLEQELPENIRVIYSCSGYYEPQKVQFDINSYFRDLDTKLLKYKKYIWDYEVKELSAYEVSLLIQSILRSSAKELITRKMAHIGNNPLFHSPGMLKALLNEMVQYGSYERIDNFTDNYLSCKSRAEFFDCLLQRLEEDYGRESIQKLMGILALVPIGLPSEDLRNYIHVSRMEWAVLNEVFSEYLTHKSGMLMLDSVDMKSTVQTRYLTDTSYVDELRRSAITILRKERKRRTPKLWDNNNKIDSLERILLGLIMPAFRLPDSKSPLFLQVNDALLDLYLALDMKRELRDEYLEGIQYTEYCSVSSQQKILVYTFNDPELFECFFTHKIILLLHFADVLDEYGYILKNMPKEKQDRIVKKVHSLWLLPASIKNEFLKYAQPRYTNSTDYFNPDCSVMDLFEYVRDTFFFCNDDSLPGIYDKVKNLLASNDCDDDYKLCLYHLMAAYCSYRLENKQGENPYYNKALELGKEHSIISHTFYPFLFENKEDYEPYLEMLRKSAALSEGNTVIKATTEVRLAMAEFLDAIASSGTPEITVSSAPDEILTTDESWRTPVENLFDRVDVTMAGYNNKYDLVCQFAQLAHIKGHWRHTAWVYSFAYRCAENADQRVYCLKKIQKLPLSLPILEKVLDLLRSDHADPHLVFTTMLSVVNAYTKDKRFNEARQMAEEVGVFLDDHRTALVNEYWYEYAYARALEKLWDAQSEKQDIKSVLEEAYMHHARSAKLCPQKNKDWYTTHENAYDTLFDICQTYGVLPVGVDYDEVLSGYKDFLSEIHARYEQDYAFCLKFFCFFLLRAGRYEEAINMVMENSTCDFYADDLAYVYHQTGKSEQCESLLSNALYKEILRELDCYGFATLGNASTSSVFDRLEDVGRHCHWLMEYNERINGAWYFTFRLLVEYVKNTERVLIQHDEKKSIAPNNKWDWQVARHTILLLNALYQNDLSEQDTVYNEAMQYIVSLYKECENKKAFSLAPIFPVLMLMAKINLKEKHQNRPADTLLWFKDVYETLVAETGEESYYIEWDLSFSTISLQRFNDDDSSEYGGLKHLVKVQRKIGNRDILSHTLSVWNEQMLAHSDIEAYNIYAYKFVHLFAETSYLNQGVLDVLIQILVYQDAKEELIKLVDYVLPHLEMSIIISSLPQINPAMLKWHEEEHLLTWVDRLQKQYGMSRHYGRTYNRVKQFWSQIAITQIRALTSLGRNEEAYQCAMQNRADTESFVEGYLKSPHLLYDFREWKFFFYAGKVAVLSGHLYDAMDFLTKATDIVNKIQDAVNSIKTDQPTFDQSTIDAYKVDNGSLMAICMLEQGNIEDGKRHFVEHVEPLLDNVDGNVYVNLYYETLAKLSH